MAAVDSDTEDKAADTKRKKTQQAKAIAKIKETKKKRKQKPVDSDDEADDDALLAALRKPQTRLPGQMDNCTDCGTRFTVTPYSRASPDGGLLCNPCGKDLDAKNPQPKKKPRASKGAGPVGTRRKMQSSLLDGSYPMGAKSLVTLCVEHLAKNIDLADELGNLQPNVIDKIARHLSKRRLMNPRTLDLFLHAGADDIRVYDAAKLSTDDIIRIFQTAPALKHLKIKNGVHFKDEVMDFMLERDFDLESFYLHGANLLADSQWTKFLEAKGSSLKSLSVQYTDKHFTDEVVKALWKNCPSLNRLKVAHNQQVSGVGVKELDKCQELQHLSLGLHKTVHSDVYVHLLSKIGTSLRTFSIRDVADADNSVLDALHKHCRHLAKLRITQSEEMTDEGFARLFQDWANTGLEFVDLEKCRHIDSNVPRSNPDNVGFCSNALRALMAHSGHSLRFLNLHACRHIKREAFEDVFALGKEYPALVDLEISFCEEVTDFIVGLIFKACPKLKELNIYGCMNVKDVRVPRGKILTGLPNALGMQIEGDCDD